jgi:hypothetical protein
MMASGDEVRKNETPADSSAGASILHGDTIADSITHLKRFMPVPLL